MLLNGGMNTLEMWMDYAEDLSRDYQVLLFDYPQALKTNQALVQGMHGFFQRLGVTRPVFIGASDGGMVAQIYVQKYPGETGGHLSTVLKAPDYLQTIRGFLGRLDAGGQA